MLAFSVLGFLKPIGILIFGIFALCILLVLLIVVHAYFNKRIRVDHVCEIDDWELTFASKVSDAFFANLTSGKFKLVYKQSRSLGLVQEYIDICSDTMFGKVLIYAENGVILSTVVDNIDYPPISCQWAYDIAIQTKKALQRSLKTQETITKQKVKV